MYSRSLLFLLISLLFVTLCFSALNTQIPLWLVAGSVSVSMIGVVGSSYFVGNLVGTLIAGFFLRHLSFKTSYGLVSLIFGIATLGLVLSFNLYSWIFWRFIAGVCCAVIWVAVESYLLTLGTPSSRGKLIGLYVTTYYLGTVLGQILLPYFPNLVLHFCLVIAIFIGLTILSILFISAQSVLNQDKKVSILPMLLHKQARPGVMGCAIAGVILGSFYTLLPVYYTLQGLTKPDISHWMTLFIVSGVATQIPFGWLSDKFGRYLVLTCEAFLIVMATIMMLFNIYPIIAIILLGAMLYTLYPISMAWACEFVSKDEIVAMNQAMLFSYTIGSLIAPVIISFLMQQYFHGYLFISAGAVGLAYFFMLIKYKSID